MPTTAQEQKLLIKLVISMFGISPGHAYLPVVEKGFEDLGRSVPDTVAALASLPQFQARYPAGMTGEAFATKFLASMGLQADAPLHRLAADLFNDGVSPQQIIFAAVQALDSPTLPPQYAAARALLENKAEVAYYHSQVLGRTETDFTALAKVLENVTQDPASVAAAKRVLDQPLVPDTGGGGPPPVFAVTKSAGNIASFTSAGTQIDVTEAGGTFTFTSSGGSVGTATLAGPLAGIAVPTGSTLSISSALASGKAFSGAGTALVVALAGGEDLTTFTGTGVGGFALTSGQNYTLTAAQAAVGRIGTTGAAGTLTDPGTTTVRDTLAALGGGVAATLKAHGADSVIASAAPSDVSAISAAGIDSIVLAAGSYTLTAAQAALVDGTTGSQTLTVTTLASGVLAASVENFVLGNFANSVTLGAATQNVSAPAGTATTLAIAGAAPTGTWALANGSDVVVATNGANISSVNGGAATTAESLTLTGGITMTQAQHEALASIAAPGSSDSVTIINSGTVTARADVETYQVGNSGTPNTVHIALGTTNVTGGSGSVTLLIDPGLALTGNYSLNTAADAINAGNGVNLSGVNGGGATSAEILTINGAISMSRAQHAAFTTIGATGGSDEVTVTTGGAVTAKAGIETYQLSAGGSNALTLAGGTSNIIGAAGNATTVDVGGNIVTGTWALGNTADTIVASTGANISGVNGGAATTAESLTLTGGIIMAQAQHEGITSITAGGGADFVTITDGGAVTARAGVENYTVSGGGANSVTLLAGTNVNGVAGNATTVNAGGNTVTGTYTLANAADVLAATDGANIASASTSTVERLALAGAITMTAVQYNTFNTGGITAAGGSDKIILATALASGEVLNAAVENFTLAAANNAVTLGAAQSIDAQALAAGQTLSLAGGFAASVSLSKGNLSSSATGSITVTGGVGGNTITLGSGNDIVTAGDGADFITGGAGVDTLNGEAGDDSFFYGAMADFLSAGLVIDRIHGDTGTDAVIISGAITLGTTSDLRRMTAVEQLKAQAQSATQNTHSIAISSETLLGDLTSIDLSGDTKSTSTANIDMTGITRDLTIKGVGAGVNNFVGGAGADTIVGGSSADFFFYADAASFISGTAVVDSIDGGGGTDAITVRGAFSVGITQSLARITNVEALRSEANGGAAHNYALSFQSDTNLGSITQIDLVYDQASGSTATVDLSGVTRAMVVTGVYQGNNTITGGSGADTLSGGRVNDTFRGGGGNDTITTSIAGTATYVFEAMGSANGSDTLTGVRNGGRFDFSGFLGTAGVVQTAAVDANVNSAGLDLTAGNNIGVRYGTSSLGSSDILLATNNAVAGEVAVADNGKVVVFSFSGASTGNNANGSIYYVQDVDSTVGVQSFAVTLVGTMSGSAVTIGNVVTAIAYL
jgi:hypothetical protein